MVESPFLPDGRRWLYSAHSLGSAKTCARRHYYESQEGWIARSASDDIIFGANYSEALEHYHKLRAEKQEHYDALSTVVLSTLQNTFTWRTENHNKNRENLIRSIVWYLDQFEHDPCQTIILADGKPAAELEFRFNVTNEIVLRGRIDRIAQYNDDNYIQDQKTTKATLGSYYFKRYNPDNQMSLYTIAAEIVWHQPVKGVMIDAAQIAVGFTRFERGFTFRTPDQNEEWLKDAKYWIERSWEYPKYDWPMNDESCMKYGGCPFREVCSKDPSVRQEFLESLFERKPRNPLETR